MWATSSWLGRMLESVEPDRLVWTVPRLDCQKLSVGVSGCCCLPLSLPEAAGEVWHEAVRVSAYGGDRVVGRGFES